MEFWVPCTITAAFLQNARSSLQRSLVRDTDVWSATSVRYFFGLPLALLAPLMLYQFGGQVFPTFSAIFFVSAILGGALQIAATALIMRLFKNESFAMTTVFAKTEPVLAALFAMILLAEAVPLSVASAIGLCVVGVVVVPSLTIQSSRVSAVMTAMRHPGAVLGVLTGGLFGLSAVLFRVAALSLEDAGVLMRACATLAVVTTLQSAVMLTILLFRRKHKVGSIKNRWPTSVVAGVSGITGSFCWFVALTLAPIAQVRALGQIELLFTFATSVFFFREKLNPSNWISALCIVASVLIVLTSVGT